jgi:hypothetical protein
LISRRLGFGTVREAVWRWKSRRRSSAAPRPWGQSWSTFVHNHLHQIWECDFLQLYDIRFRPIKCGADFDRAAKGAGVRVLRTAVKASLMNSLFERFLALLGGVALPWYFACACEP